VSDEITRAGESNAREPHRLSYLAKRVPCRYCSAPVVLAICRDGRWRIFNPQEQPPAPTGSWAWRKRHGMEETDRVPGYRQHFCHEYAATKTSLAHILAGMTHPEDDA
jgi:hypothetical protein